MNIIVVGSSSAGISAVETLRKLNQEAKITMITSDDRLPYYRPMLSHMIGESEYPTNFNLKTKEYFKEKNIEVIINTQVKSIDKEEKKIITIDNIKYD